MLQHYLWSVDPQRLVRPFETLGTATSRRTLRDFRNRNISSDPSRLWEPQHLVRPFETLGTATSRRTLRDSGNRNVSSDPSRLLEPQHLVRPFETLGTANVSSDPSRLWEPQHLVRPFEALGTVHRTDRRRVLGDVFEHRKGSGRWDRSLFVHDPVMEQ
jgi:hypothetical protein